ncbi:MAG: heat shock protein HspQ [Leptospiraceae bacterium]|nr:heat shock protein HspQ [Leptospiraceae bacterium]
MSEQDRMNRFHVGELVFHVRYNYRGVIFAYDTEFRGSDDWYASNRSQPARDQPWYHVLVDQANHTTYVAEENLIEDSDQGPIQHPLVEKFFATFLDGHYYVNSMN